MTGACEPIYRPIVSRGQRFVGRETELGALVGALRAAASGNGGLALVAGEPGIGKTRLVAEATRLAAAETGAIALWGRCPDAEGAPPFWPWRQVLSAARSQLDVGGLDEIERLLGQSSGTADASPSQARFELFERVAVALRSAAEERPLAVVLDDLHWADLSSVKLLQHLAREVASARVLLLVTFREVEPSASAEVARLLGELAGLGYMLPLRGLAESEVADLIADRAGVVPRPRLVHAVHEATRGNPFFVDEVVRLLAAERRLEGGDDDRPGAIPIPVGVRAAISRRVDGLGPSARPVLATAAIAGRDIDAGIVALVTGAARAEVLATLEAAARSGLLARGPGASDAFSFSHALVQETLYESLPADERARSHRRIGEAIESMHRHDLDPHLAELAHHFAAAARGGGDAKKASDYGLRAGEAALRQLAFEEAERELARALAALDLADGDTTALRCQIALAIADARSGAGDLAGMNESFREGVDLARRVGPEAFAEAVLRLSHARVESFFVDRLLVDLLEEAIERLPAGPSTLRARCLARLGAALHLDPASEKRRTELTDEAVAMARALGDRRALAWVLMMRIVAVLGPDNLEERLALEGEIMRLADETGYVVASLEAQSWRVHDLLELGDIRAVDLAIESFARTAERLKRPVYAWHVATWRVMRAILDGRLADTERLLEEALAAGQRAQQQGALLRYGEGLMMLRYEQGRLRELEGLVRMGADQAPDVPAWRIALASMHLQNERFPEARAELDRLAAHGFDDLPRDSNWLFSVVSLAHIACELGDVERARRVYDLLRPYAGRMTAGRPAVSFSGGVSHFLGRLAARVGDGAAARTHFENAVREHRQLGAVAWIARSQTEYARLLLEAGDERERPRALELATAAHEVASRLGLEEVRPGAEEVLARARDRAATAAHAGEGARVVPGARAADAPNAFVCEGEFWRLAFQGSEIRIRDLTGIRQIAYLLRNPGRDISVLDLLDVSGRRRIGGDAHPNGGPPSMRDAGEILDRRARAEYRAEMASLESELEEARSFNDLGRVQTIEAEIAAISGELSRALGLGGRPRRIGAPIERARVSVTRTIRDAIRRIGSLHPRLGRFLDESIATGRFCCYRPALDRELVWRVA